MGALNAPLFLRQLDEFSIGKRAGVDARQMRYRMSLCEINHVKISESELFIFGQTAK